MKNRKIWVAAGTVLAFCAGLFVNSAFTTNVAPSKEIKTEEQKLEDMRLGAFSISLSVKDLKVSRDFYNKLGFEVLGGAMEQNYLIMKNENALIGLFQGMFEGNILTFNPGWDEFGQNIEDFEDIREIQARLKVNGVEVPNPIARETSGPASLILQDPDGNTIFIDQHR